MGSISRNSLPETRNATIVVNGTGYVNNNKPNNCSPGNRGSCGTAVGRASISFSSSSLSASVALNPNVKATSAHLGLFCSSVTDSTLYGFTSNSYTTQNFASGSASFTISKSSISYCNSYYVVLHLNAIRDTSRCASYGSILRDRAVS